MININAFIADFEDQMEESDLGPVFNYLLSVGATHEIDQEGTESDKFLYDAIVAASSHDNWQVVFEHGGHSVSHLPTTNIWLLDWRDEMVGGVPRMLFLA